MARPAAAPIAHVAGEPRQESLWRLFWRRLWRDRPAVVSAAVLLLLFAAAALAPLLATHDRDRVVLADKHAPPLSRGKDGKVHLLGADALGRDIYTRILFGARISLSVGFVSVGLRLAIGVPLGAIAGYYGGAVDHVLMRLTDVFLSIPLLLLIITVLAFIGSNNIFLIMAVIGITSWAGPARLVRGEFLSLRERDYTQAARALGAREARIIFRHILPNAMAPIIVNATLGVAGAILTEAALSYLGVGVQPPVPSWGNMLLEAQGNMRVAWWPAVFPGVAIFITALAFYRLGDGLRDALDPRLKE